MDYFLEDAIGQIQIKVRCWSFVPQCLGVMVCHYALSNYDQ